MAVLLQLQQSDEQVCHLWLYIITEVVLREVIDARDVVLQNILVCNDCFVHDLTQSHSVLVEHLH